MFIQKYRSYDITKYFILETLENDRQVHTGYVKRIEGIFCAHSVRFRVIYEGERDKIIV